jgi:hypothetical protein
MRAQVEFEWRAPAQPAARRGLRRGKRSLRLRRRPGVGRRGSELRRARAAQWRVVRALERSTDTGIKGVHGGDPAGTSKAMCLIY